ncbi:hypothetical protein OPQ81_000346 [Rhizoctonia solani]|nr:hypothetical protein OPQ81_000346 [Rhizoctonia solani]
MSRPGPARTSCLTCRQRHKKCDLRQPICERCEQAEYECLGYGHIQEGPATVFVTEPNRRLLPKPPENRSPSLQITLPGVQGNRLISGPLPRRGRSKNKVSASLSAKPPNPLDSNVSDRPTVVTGSSVSTVRRTFDLYARLPNPITDFSKVLDNQWFVDAIVGRLEKLTDYWYFKPPMAFFRSLRHELALDLTPRQLRDRWTAWIHVALVKIRLAHGSNAHWLLRNITPAFLQVAYSRPALWSSDCDLTRIPLQNILTWESHELAMFTLYDCTFSMAYGLPQQVEYDTTIYPRPDSAPSHQWVHTTPVEFQLVLANINACRDKSPAARDWNEIERIEQWLLTWQSRSGEYAFAESWMTVAWYAVQESWRLALLVYLYLAVCDASSDDLRIQSRVKQILQVLGTLKTQGLSHVNVSFFPQYLMVGICARSEAHRKIVSDKLTSANKVKLCLLRASDFAPYSLFRYDMIRNPVLCSGFASLANSILNSKRPRLNQLHPDSQEYEDIKNAICASLSARGVNGGDFECLGYGHIQEDLPAAIVTRPSRRLLPKPPENGSPPPQITSSGFQGNRLISGSLSLRGTSENTVSASSSPKLSVPWHLNAFDSSTEAGGVSLSLLRRLFDLYSRLPHPNPDLSKSLDSQWFIDAVVGRLEKIMDHWYFRIPGYRENFRPAAIQRLYNSKFVRWNSLLSMSVLESFLAGDMSQNQLHNTWIEYIKGYLEHELALDLTPYQIRDRRSAWVHVSLMKSRLVDSSNAYRLLRSIAPAFLEVVYSNPAFWSGDRDLTRIPLLNILSSESHELAMFTLIDCTFCNGLWTPPTGRVRHHSISAT